MRHARLRKGLLSTAAVIGGWVCAGGAHAQTPPPPPGRPLPQATANGEPTQLGEVVVTAQKRVQRAMDVPLAVTALNAQDLVATNQVSLNDYFHSVPGLTLYDNGEGFKQLVIRGITTGNGNTPTVGVYIDDTPIGSSTAAARGDVLVPDIDPSDLSQIEVLKGPQGTLYGASNMGGLLKYVTTPPDLNRFGGRVEVDGSSVAHGGDGYGVRAAVNIPLIADQLALRVSGASREDPGYLNNVQGPSHDVNRAFTDNGRVALLWRPSAILDVKLNWLYQQRESHGSSREDYNFGKHQLVYGDLEQSRVPGTEYDHERQQIYNATVDLHLGWATLTSSTSYAKNAYKSDADVTSLFGPIFQPVFADAFGVDDFGAALFQAFKTNKFTEEVRLTGTEGKIDWIGGVFYTRENSHFYQDFRSVQNENGQPLTLGGVPFDEFLPLADSIGVSHYNEVAAFGDVTYHFTPKASLQLGLRYSYNYQSSISFSHDGLLGDGSTSDGRSHEGVPTFVVAPEYRLTRDTTLYARIASGYRAGGPNTTLGGDNVPSFGSDTTVNYEAGVKTFLFGHKVYVEADGFYITWDNIQLLGTNALSEEFYQNAGGAVSRGVELNGQWHVLPGLTFGGNFTYDDAHLTDPAPSGIAGATGDRLPYSPRVAGQITLDYSHRLFGDWTGVIGGDASYLGDRESDFQSSFATPRIRLPSYSLLGLHAGLDNGRYSLNVFAKNVTDSRGFEAANALTLSHRGAYAVAITQPQTVGFSVAAKF